MASLAGLDRDLEQGIFYLGPLGQSVGRKDTGKPMPETSPIVPPVITRSKSLGTLKGFLRDLKRAGLVVRENCPCEPSPGVICRDAEKRGKPRPLGVAYYRGRMVVQETRWKKKVPFFFYSYDFVSERDQDSEVGQLIFETAEGHGFHPERGTVPSGFGPQQVIWITVEVPCENW